MRASDDDANETEAPTDWQAVDWQQASRRVRNLRQRIFRASREGDTRTVRSLQQLLLRSYSNTLLSVRRVTQDNAGRRTAGVAQGPPPGRRLAPPPPPRETRSVVLCVPTRSLRCSRGCGCSNADTSRRRRSAACCSPISAPTS